MTPSELEEMAQAWIEYYRPGATVDERARVEWATSMDYDLLYENPEELWRLVLVIHQLNHSNRIQEVLSAGPVEDLLNKHGEAFIDRIEREAVGDPAFAKLLGGVWKSDIADAIWSRVQAVWDRRGWDGIPE